MEHAISEKAYKGIGMEGPVARWYASLTHKSMDEFSALARRVHRELPPAARVLEVAPGPGYFAIELSKLGGCAVTGLDISHTFVEIASRNAAQAGVSVDFRRGNAAKMPFPDSSFDFLVCRAAFKNFSEPVPALQEMYRVLKPGGRALIIDLRKDASSESVARAIDRMGLSRINALITRMTFRFMLLKRAYTQTEFEELISHTGFESVKIVADLIGLEITLERTT